MKLWKKLTLAAAAAALALFAALAAFVVWIGTPTRGVPIPAYANPWAAVLVIDIQEDYTGPQAKKRFRDGDRIVAASNALSNAAYLSGRSSVGCCGTCWPTPRTPCRRAGKRASGPGPRMGEWS
jgi:hypothetical protein